MLAKSDLKTLSLFIFANPGFGVEQLRDGTTESYWQSDGQLPHLVNICFKRKTTVSAVAVYTDFRLDESYTPSKISLR